MRTSFPLPMLTLLDLILTGIVLAAPGTIIDEKPSCDLPHHHCRVGYCSEEEIPSGMFCFEPVILCCKHWPKQYKRLEEKEDIAPFGEVLRNLL